MRAVVLRRHGPAEILSLESVPDPTTGSEQVLVAVEAIGLNFAEVLSRKGLYGWSPDLPYVLGMEAVGVIEEIGDRVEGRKIGERVLVASQFGSYAEKIAVTASSALPALDSYTPEENAAFGVNYMTAWVSLLEMARIRHTDRVLVTAAAGGVGTAAVQIASSFGCEVVALASSDAKLQLARDLGATDAVCYGNIGFPDQLLDTVGSRGIDVALETVGGHVFKACADCLAPFGRIVVAGYAELDYKLWNPISLWRAWRGMPRMSMESMYKGSKGLLSTHLGYLVPYPEIVRPVWDRLTTFVEEHKIRPIVGHVFQLADVAEAHQLMESRGSMGKIVMRV